MANVVKLPTPEGARILQQWNLERARERGGKALVMRGHRGHRAFAGAETSRLTASFSADHASMNQDLETSLRLMVGRSRQQAKNNDYVKKFLRMAQNHIVGPDGFRLHVPCTRLDGSLDVADSLIVEQAFSRWGKKGVCEVTGRLSFRLLCRLLIVCAARDGEALVRRVRNRGANDFGYQLQVIDPVLLDYTYRADLGNGNRIRMGVEVNADSRPVAYHLLTNVEARYANRRVRVPASEIFHFFLSEEPDQVRAAPWVHTAMRRLNDLGGYEQAAVIAARIGASKMGFYTQPPNAAGGPVNPNQLADGLEDETDPNSELIKEAEPGVFEVLPEGVGFESFDPAYPHQNYDVFVKACLRGVASGLDVDYNTLANDLENVNYSSIRHGMLETRESWMQLQNWFKESFLEPLYTEWLEMAFLSGQLQGLPVSKFAKYDVGQWQGRRWSWVDPKGDTEAKLLEINNGLASYSGYIREKGGDPEAVWRELEKDKARIKGLLPDKQPAPAAAPPAAVATSGA